MSVRAVRRPGRAARLARMGESRCGSRRHRASGTKSRAFTGVVPKAFYDLPGLKNAGFHGVEIASKDFSVELWRCAIENGRLSMIVSVRDYLMPRFCLAGCFVALLSGAAYGAGTQEQANARSTGGVQADNSSHASGEAKYRNCPRGFYSGPRPDRVHYTKDRFFWVVTPEFAAQFCMPTEYVSTELKGAEAIAYELVRDPSGEVICSRVDKKEVCSDGGGVHSFEVYYKTGEFPRRREENYMHLADMQSLILISRTLQESKDLESRVRASPVIGARSVFNPEQFGLQSVFEGKIAWPLGTLYSDIYYREALTGLDYVRLRGASGFSKNPGYQKSGTKKFVITVRKEPDPSAGKASWKMEMSEWARVIEIPKSMVDRIILRDMESGVDGADISRRFLSGG